MSARTMQTMVRRKAQSGISLLEVLLCLMLITLLMVPFVMTMGGTAQNARAAYLQSTRSILLNSLKAEAVPGDPNYGTYSDTSTSSSAADSGQVIGYRRVIDTTTANASTVMKRTGLFYLYTNPSDASNAPRYRTTQVYYPKSFRLLFGGNNNVIDTVNRFWFNDNLSHMVYDSSNQVPGWDSSYPFTLNTNNILNATGNDDALYWGEIDGGILPFAMSVENGAYTVKLLFCETSTSITSTNTRRMNITIEGSLMNTEGPYSPYESTGATNRAEIKMYDVMVNDGVLNITFSKDPSSNDPNANPHGIEVIKRGLQ